MHFFLKILLLGGPSPPSQLKLLNFFYLIVNFMMMPECNSLQSLMGKYTKNNLCEILLSGEKPHIPDKYQHIIVKQVHFLCSPKIYLQNQKTVFWSKTGVKSIRFRRKSAKQLLQGGYTSWQILVQNKIQIFSSKMFGPKNVVRFYGQFVDKKPSLFLWTKKTWSQKFRKWEWSGMFLEP